LRKLIFWLHLSAGVAAGLVILVMAVTGALLTYEKLIIAWADRTTEARPPTPQSDRMDPDALLANLQLAVPGVVVSGLTISSVHGVPLLVATDGPMLAVNAYTGSLIGEASPRTRWTFRQVTALHRWLGAEGPAREVTRALTGWGNVLFLLIVLGGLYMWVPRKWTLAQWRAVGLLRPGLRGRARDFNWHNAIGIWSAVPLLLIVATALPMSFPWANAALYRMAGEAPPEPRGGRPQRPASETGVRVEGGQRRQEGTARASEGGADPLAGIGRVLARAEQQVPGWRTMSVRLPNAADAPLAITIDRGTGGQPQRRGMLTLDRVTAEVVGWETYEDLTPGRRLRTLARFTHTGEVFGLTGQTIAGLASACAGVLVWTGLALTFRRFRAWTTRRRQSSATAARVPTAA